MYEAIAAIVIFIVVLFIGKKWGASGANEKNQARKIQEHEAASKGNKEGHDTFSEIMAMEPDSPDGDSPSNS